MRRAVFLPIPGMSEIRATSVRRTASSSSAGSIPERMFSASFGPIPEMPMSFRKSLLLRGRREPEEGEGVVRHVGVDEQLDLGARSRPA